MIGKLKGIVDEIDEDYCLVDVHGVGYVAYCSARTLAALPGAGEAVMLFIETYVREDMIRLYGFQHGAGARMVPAADEQCAGRRRQGGAGDPVDAGRRPISPTPSRCATSRMVSRAPGVGKKVAERIVTELKNKAPAFAGHGLRHHRPEAGTRRGRRPGADRRRRLGADQSRLFARHRRQCGGRGAEDGRRRRRLGQADPARAEGTGAVIAAGVEHPDAAGRSDAANLDRPAANPDWNRARDDQPARLISPDKRGEDADASLRPQTLDEFVGQAEARANLKVFIEAAKGRGEALDHVLFVGPPGLGKTTLAQIMARELGVNFRSTSGPVIAKAGDLAALLTNLEDRDVLFIDEIHRLNPAVEEILYPAMEDFQLDLIIGEGPAARSVKIDLAKFTLVAATTRLGLLTNPLRDRFGIPVRLNFYSVEELEQIVRRGARILRMPLGDDGALEIARRARGTPRIAGRLLRRVRDFASVAGAEPCRRARSPTRRCAGWRSTRSASTSSTAAISR